MNRIKNFLALICIISVFSTIFTTDIMPDDFYKYDGYTNDSDISSDNPSYTQNIYHSIFKLGLAGPGVTAWDYATGKDVNVAIIDAGADLYDKELNGNIKGVYNAITDSEEWSDVQETSIKHGTLCAKVLGAVGNNKLDNAGVAYNVNLYIIKAGDSKGIYTDAVIRGIRWAAEKKCRVISMSFGSSHKSEEREELINQLYTQSEDSILFVAAGGNTGKEEYHYPASYANVLSVSAVDYSIYNGYSVLPGCTYNDHIDIAAPGKTTSAATPYVAGVAALIFQINPSLTAKECADIITSTAKDAGSKGWDKKYGFGIIQPLTAVEKAKYKTDALTRQISVPASYVKTIGDKSFNLSAKATGSGVIKYKSDNKKVATVSSNGTVTIKGVGKTYINITIEKSGIFSSASKRVEITVKKPKRPFIKSVKKTGAQKIKIKWKKNKKVSGYRIYISKNKKFERQEKITIRKNTKGSKTIKGLKKNQRYYIKMRAYKVVNNKKIYSKYSKIKKIKL